MLSVAAVLALGATTALGDMWTDNPGKHPTPIGWVSHKCIHAAQSKVELEPIHNGVWATYHNDDGTTTKEFHPELPECVEEIAQLTAEYKARQERAQADTLTDEDLKDGWLIYGGYWTPGLEGRFDSKYVIPNDPPAGVDGQLLYYFIGLQDNSDNNLTIIQPVVAYCGTRGGCGYNWYQSGWMLSSWNCCPSGQVWYGSGVVASAGETIPNFVSAKNGIVEISMTGSRGTSDLILYHDYRQYNWADFTLEAYGYSSCDQFNNDKFWFNNMAIQGADGSNYNPSWDMQNANPLRCGGQIKCSDAANCYITGSS